MLSAFLATTVAFGDSLHWSLSPGVPGCPDTLNMRVRVQLVGRMEVIILTHGLV